MSEEAQKESLATIFRRLIANTGPISLMHYMGESNARYYDSRDPLGSAGDFVTAPEISQMFGELIGLWLADMWINAGREEPVHYVELGPGRGTLAQDALRTAKRYGLEPTIHFVESSTELKDVQLAAIPGAQWHHDLSTAPPYGPILLVANEFLDALPVRQLVKTPDGWRERMVVPEGERFVCVAGSQPMDAAVPEARRAAEPGTIIETCPGAAAAVYEVAGRLVDQGGAALFIDYGHDQIRDGSTLQAVRDHLKVDPFVAPGEADLTAHVDFATLAPIALSRGCKWLGTVPQGRWLRNLGIEARAQTLAAAAPQHAAAIESAKERLVSEGQMGLLFKVMGLASPSWPGGAGF
ncbi:MULTISPECIES: SAM-dependent methyltransferase [unclassified Novosphingobium]|uniref:class I SAM-dependent methyltransferase n=1 Tax=unclassified Novosphingobium TaxID=2644732 RepID=UPI0025DA6BF7|nr:MULTISPECIES: SAM-dependent methyltransferase [unclassified Novosphingobium]HQV03288.1 SAM-dependent methyltransferase [Novosphingobium sp.]